MNARSPSDDHAALIEYVRYRRTLFFLVLAGLLFCAGQGVRLYLDTAQSSVLEARNRALYVSALGADIGEEPFGRLQFEHGKLLSSRAGGLDPLGVLAMLSRSAPPDLRVDSLEIHGRRAVVQGFFGPASDGLDRYVAGLQDDMDYAVALESRQDTVGGVEFVLAVTPR